MRPIVFCRVASMKYYRGITKNDQPYQGSSFVQETGYAHECYNFDVVETQEDNYCLGYVMLNGSKGMESELHIENIIGCSLMEQGEKLEDVTVVWVAKSPGSKHMRCVGFYKHATVFRKAQEAMFQSDDGETYYQTYNFVAKAEDCILLPYNVRHSESRWYVPSSNKNGYDFGFGRSNIWYAKSKKMNKKLNEYVEKMINSIDSYDGENWMEREV